MVVLVPIVVLNKQDTRAVFGPAVRRNALNFLKRDLPIGLGPVPVKDAEVLRGTFQGHVTAAGRQLAHEHVCDVAAVGLDVSQVATVPAQLSVKINNSKAGGNGRWKAVRKRAEAGRQANVQSGIEQIRKRNVVKAY